MACYTIVSNEDKKRCALSFAKAFMTRHYIDTTAMVTVAWNMENSRVVVCEFCFLFYDINFCHFHIQLQKHLCSYQICVIFQLLVPILHFMKYIMHMNIVMISYDFKFSCCCSLKCNIRVPAYSFITHMQYTYTHIFTHTKINNIQRYYKQISYELQRSLHQRANIYDSSVIVHGPFIFRMKRSGTVENYHRG